MRGVAGNRLGVLTWVALIDRDHVLVDVLLVRVVLVPVVEVVDMIIVAHGGVAAIRAMLVWMRAFMYVVSHTLTLRGRRCAGKFARDGRRDFASDGRELGR